MMDIGVQTQNVIKDECPQEGFEMLKRAGFTCCDFSLNSYLLNLLLYRFETNDFFDKSQTEIEAFFAPHKEAAKTAGIRINQMHMPYPNYVPDGSAELNDYLKNVVAQKSMRICAFMDCQYIVIHGFKLARYLGSEEAEWEKTLEFIEFLAPLAKELGITICIENLYTSLGKHIIEGPCCDAGKAADRIDAVNQKYGAEVLGFCFDTGHANLVGIDFENFLTILGSRLKVLHIHDNDGIGDLHQLPFTFTNSRENTTSTDWEGFLKGLRKIRFNGVLSFETAPALTAFPNIMKEDVLRFIARIGRYFAGALGKG
ncbi:MAG: sugar phosphate isomerase/epimerase [Roseburia sp.]|nr:sugar phosphate isomerase/epimerase [Roseburia sp.]MCM1201630.1 sugar phosphate isomerase/epimerase [Bacteroides fragilis]